MMTLGITGRSGCGKSTVTAALRAHGVPCVDADQTAREVLAPGSPCLAAVLQAFGADLLRGGVLDRRALADRAFATPEGTRRLSALTQPEIVRRVAEAREAARRSGAWLFAVDAAVLIGSAFEKECDRVLVVTAPFAASVQRICQRDGISPEMAARRLSAQRSEQELCARADYVICNDGGREALLAQTERFYETIREELHA